MERAELDRLQEQFGQLVQERFPVTSQFFKEARIGPYLQPRKKYMIGDVS